MADVAVASRREVRRAADILAARERQFRRRPVNPRFDRFDDGLFHLLAVAVQELNAVIVERIVARADHDAGVKALGPHHIGDTRGRRHMQEVHIRARGREARRERILEHVARAARVLADCNLAARAVRVLLPVVPAEIPSHLIGMHRRELDIGLAAKAVRSEILAHYASSRSSFT